MFLLQLWPIVTEYYCSMYCLWWSSRTGNISFHFLSFKLYFEKPTLILIRLHLYVILHLPLTQFSMPDSWFFIRKSVFNYHLACRIYFLIIPLWCYTDDLLFPKTGILYNSIEDTFNICDLEFLPLCLYSNLKEVCLFTEYQRHCTFHLLI